MMSRWFVVLFSFFERVGRRALTGRTGLARQLRWRFVSFRVVDHHGAFGHRLTLATATLPTSVRATAPCRGFLFPLTSVVTLLFHFHSVLIHAM